MKNDEKNISGYQWIPWNRYLFLLEIDGKKTIALGRFRRAEGLRRKAIQLQGYKGYLPTIVDTKKNEVIEHHIPEVFDTKQQEFLKVGAD